MTRSSSAADLEYCTAQISKMLDRSQTKVIFPIIALGLIREYCKRGKKEFTDSEIRNIYHNTVRQLKKYLGHDLHIGGKYYDAYPSRNLPKYGVLRVLGSGTYHLQSRYCNCARELKQWIPGKIRAYISTKLGIISKLNSRENRSSISADNEKFSQVIAKHLDVNPANFEIFSFAILKVHLEKFACKIYRDTRTAAHDRGVDISTDFGVVYQVKKMIVANKKAADGLIGELEYNFDSARINDGRIVVVIDDISSTMKQYLVNMKVQSLSKKDLLQMASQIDDIEDREKLLRIVYEEFRREYASDI